MIFEHDIALNKKRRNLNLKKNKTIIFKFEYLYIFKKNEVCKLRKILL